MVISVLGAGFYITFVAPPRQVLVRVGDVKYTRGDMVKLLRAKQATAVFFGGQFNAGLDVFQALQDLVENEIIVQSAPSLGISLSEEEIDAHIRGLFSTDGGSSASVGSRLEERAFQEQYRSYLNTIQIGTSDHRRWVRQNLLREKFTEFIGQSVPAAAEQVHLYRIRMFDRDELDIMQTKFKDIVGLANGPEELREGFTLIAKEFSRDPQDIVRKGGDLGWAPRGVFEDHEYAFFELEIGKLSDPAPNLEAPNEIFFFMVSERSPQREVDPKNREILKRKALQDWVNDQREKFDIYAAFDSDQYAWVVQQLRLTVRPTPIPGSNTSGF